MFSNHKRDNIWKHLDGKWKGLCCSTPVAHLGKPPARNGLSQKGASPAGLHWVGGSWIWLELRLNRHACAYTHTHRHMSIHTWSEAACMGPGLLHAGVSQDEGSPGSENDGSLPDPWHLGHGASPRLCMEMLTRSSVLARDIPWTEEPGGLQSVGLQRVRRV